MNEEIHTAATLLTYYLMDDGFFVGLARDDSFAPRLSEMADALVGRAEWLFSGVDGACLEELRKKTAFYETFL